MKKILFFMAFTSFFTMANAQFVYTPYMQGQSQNQQSSSNEQNTIRTTSYCINSYGNIVKMPIKVQLKQYSGISDYYVIERYVDTGFGGKWESIYNSPKIQKCNSIYASNSLEKQFMYKALISIDWYYFDL